jgi:hypothetical protein
MCSQMRTSFATVTPSLTILGEPYLLSRTTFRPFGPRVTPTRSASLLTPFWHIGKSRNKKVQRQDGTREGVEQQQSSSQEWL